MHINYTTHPAQANYESSRTHKLKRVLDTRLLLILHCFRWRWYCMLGIYEFVETWIDVVTFTAEYSARKVNKSCDLILHSLIIYFRLWKLTGLGILLVLSDDFQNFRTVACYLNESLITSLYLERLCKCSHILFRIANIVFGPNLILIVCQYFMLKMATVAPYYPSTGHPHIICQRVQCIPKIPQKIIFLDLHQHPQLVSIKQLSKNNTAPTKKTQQKYNYGKTNCGYIHVGKQNNNKMFFLSNA